MKGETIAAISTAVSSSGIGIVRISGDQAFEIADRVYRSPKGKKKLSEQQSHTVHYGYICDGDEVLDEVLVVLMRAPRSFTAEDTVEIDFHGGVYAIQRVLEAVIKNGAAPAEPGEFVTGGKILDVAPECRAQVVILQFVPDSTPSGYSTV